MQQPPQENQPIINHPRVSFTETFASSQDEKTQRYGLDPILARGIMQNNSSLIIQQQKQINLDQNIGFNKQEQLSKLVIQFQSKYNQVKNECVQTQNRIKRYKEDIQRLTQQNKKLSIDKIDAEMNLDKYTNNYGQNYYQLQRMVMRFDSYINIEERIKLDITYYKKMIFQANLALMKKRSEVKRYDSSNYRQKKISMRCKTLLHSIDSSLVKNQSNRNFGIQKMQRLLTQKQDFALKRKQRQLKIHNSMMQGKSDKLVEQKTYTKLFYTNKLVKAILFFKMKRLMSQYKQVYDSFNLIKQYTNIKTGEQLIQRYLKKDQTYGILLTRISNLQPKIQELKAQKLRLQQNRDKIMGNRLQIQQEYHKLKKEGQNINFKELQRLNSQIQMIDLYKYSWSNWALQTQSSFRAVSKQQISINYQSFTPLIKDSLNAILKFIQKSEKQQKDKSILEEAFQKQIKKAQSTPQDILSRNLRIKTLGSEQIQQQQDQDGEYDFVSEKDYMNMARRAVKKQFIMKKKNRYFK